MRTNSQTQLSNELHYVALSVVESFKNSGGKIKVFDAMRREVGKPLSKGRKK